MKELNRKIENTLNALDGMERAQAPDDFEQKLNQRLSFVPEWIKWLRYSAAALVIFGILNVMTVLSISTESFASEETDFMEENLLTDTTYPILTFSEE